MIGQLRIAVAAWVATVLGATVLIPVFSGPFLFVSAFVCGILTATAGVLQRWRLPRLLHPLIQLLVLVETVALLFYRDTLRYAIVPWKATALAFDQQMAEALNGVNRFSAPLPPEPYFTVFAVGVIGISGLLIHLIAVQLRQAAWAGLLLLVMYTVPAATVHGGLSALLFVPPAVGYVLLLAAEGRSRLTRWGRRIGGPTAMEANAQVEASAAGQAGRRIGVTVIALAALLPALLPTLPEGVLGNGLSGSGAGPGIGGTVSLGGNPMLDMGRNLRRGENSVALSYTGDGPTYLRFTALDMFDGQTWQIAPRTSLVDVDGTFRSPPGLSKATDSLQQRRHQVAITKWLRSPWVPVPYPPRSLSISGKWRYNATTMDVTSTNGRGVAGLKYNVTSYDLSPAEPDLKFALETGPPDQQTSQVPQSTPASIRNLAKEVTAAAKGNRYLQAALLQGYFRDNGGFTYDVKTDGRSGMRALESFLLDTKRGYCEQFATSMALMARTLGIPARVGLGFLPGKLEDGRYVVRMHDMHAWPELYFEGIGWVRFEPTPAVQTGQPPIWTVPAEGPDAIDDTSPSPGESASPQDSAGVDGHNLPGDENLPENSGSTAGADQGWWGRHSVRWATVGSAAALLCLVPWLVRSLVRRRRFGRSPGPESVEGLWAEIRDTARDLGLGWSETATPRQAGVWLTHKVPADVRPQAIRLARAVERCRYAGNDPTAVDIRSEAEAVRSAVVRSMPAGRRWRARLLPRSWRWYLSRGTAEASELLDEFEMALARLRALLAPRRGTAP